MCVNDCSSLGKSGMAACKYELSDLQGGRAEFTQNVRVFTRPVVFLLSFEQRPCLENPMDRGVRQAIVHGVAKSQTRLSN